MGATRKKRKNTDRTTPQASPQTPSSVGMIQPPVPAPPISQEVRDELTATMQELLLKTHELSFEYSTLDCKDIHKCPLANKCRELFKTVKKMHNLLKQIQPPSNKGYIS